MTDNNVTADKTANPEKNESDEELIQATVELAKEEQEEALQVVHLMKETRKPSRCLTRNIP